jgi:hypothetical protein
MLDLVVFLKNTAIFLKIVEVAAKYLPLDTDLVIIPARKLPSREPLPSDLLRPESGVVKFQLREPELADIDDW